MAITRRSFTLATIVASAAAADRSWAQGELERISKAHAGKTVRVLFGGGGAWDALAVGAKELAAAAGINLEITVAGYNDRYSKFILDTSTGANSFDCYPLAYQWKYDVDKSLADFSEMAAKVEGAAPLTLEDYPAQPLEIYAKANNRLIGLPIIGDVTFIGRNTRLLRNAGASTAPPTSWNDVVRNGRQVKNDQIAGYALPAGKTIQTANIWTLIFHANGGRYFASNGAPLFDSPESVNAVRMLSDELQEINPPGNLTWDFPQVLNSLTSGQSAQAMIWAGSISAARDRAKSPAAGNLEFSPTPNVSLLGGWAISVNRSSKALDAAVFLSTWLTSEAMTRRMVPLGGAPLRKSVLSDARYAASHPQYQAILGSLEGAVVQFPPIPQSEQLQTIIYDELNAVLSRTKAVEPAIADMQRKAVAFLNRRGLIK